MAYPFKKYNYKVEIDGITEASFSEVSGFDASIDVIESPCASIHKKPHWFERAALLLEFPDNNYSGLHAWKTIFQVVLDLHMVRTPSHSLFFFLLHMLLLLRVSLRAKDILLNINESLVQKELLFQTT